MTIGAAKSAGRLATTRDRASIPPADDPITTSWDSVVSCFTTMPHSSHRSRVETPIEPVAGFASGAEFPSSAGRSPMRIVTGDERGCAGTPPPLSRLERLLGKPPQPVGQIPAFDVDECSGPRRVVRPQARRPPGGGLRAFPCPRPGPLNPARNFVGTQRDFSSRATDRPGILWQQTRWVDRVPSPRGSGPYRVCKPLAAGNNQMARGFTLSAASPDPMR